LHLIRPLGFDTSEKACRRAGLDYWARLSPTEHDSWDAYLLAHPDVRPWVFTTKAARPVWDADLRRGDHLLFGKETCGLPESILEQYEDRLVTLPMVPGERSLNLATAVCGAVIEGMRQCVLRGEAGLLPDGRLDIDPAHRGRMG